MAVESGFEGVVAAGLGFGTLTMTGFSLIWRAKDEKIRNIRCRRGPEMTGDAGDIGFKMPSVASC